MCHTWWTHIGYTSVSGWSIAPSRSIDSAQSSPHSHLPNSLYSLFPSMGDDNNHSEPWNKTYWYLAAVVSFVILWIACSYYCYRQHLKKAAARQAQYQARLSALRFVGYKNGRRVSAITISIINIGETLLSCVNRLRLESRNSQRHNCSKYLRHFSLPVEGIYGNYCSFPGDIGLVDNRALYQWATSYRRAVSYTRLKICPEIKWCVPRNSDRGQPYEDLKNTPTQANEVAAQTEELLNTNEEPSRNMIQTIRTLEEEHVRKNPTTSEEPTASTCERVDLLDRLSTTIEVLEAENQSLKLQLKTCECADYKGNNRLTVVKSGSLNIQYRCIMNLVANISPDRASAAVIQENSSCNGCFHGQHAIVRCCPKGVGDHPSSAS
ncbi:hypothetical protein J6590_081087 [Homalodisca vitripennis]|nr:hypothetical protein J6590_081087 [Homalodisca vitripennis]